MRACHFNRSELLSPIMQCKESSLSLRLGTTIHVSALLRRVERLAAKYNAAMTAANVEDRMPR